LNKIQSLVYKGHKLDENEKEEWRSNVRAVKEAGYVLKKKVVKNDSGMKIGVTWFASSPKESRFVAEFVYTDTRPNDGLPHCKGDCTTRAMAYILKGAASYREIEEEQYRNAEERNRKEGLFRGDGCSKYHRNTNGVWDKTMEGFGYVWVKIHGAIRRDKLAKILSSLSHPVISQSASHVSVLDGGNVIDTWDSRGGRCTCVMVDSNDRFMVEKLLGGFA
jgi:hypothetical protein